MAGTNEIKEIKEEQKVVEGYEQPTTNESESIYSHLTEEDLNADYKPQEEADAVEASEEVSTEDVEEVASSTTNEEASEEVKTSEDSSQQWDINGTTYSKEDMETRMVKDYENLSSFSGKQAEQIGGYKQRITELEAKIQTGNTTEAKTAEKETASAPTESKDYDIYTQEGMMTMAQDIAQKEIERYKSETKAIAEEERQTNAAETAKENFIKRHPEYSEQAIVELVQFGASKGIALGDTTNHNSITNYLENVHGLKSGDYSFFTENSSSGKKEPTLESKTKTIEAVEEAKKVKPNLGNVNSTQQEVDYDNLSNDDWAKLPEEKRNELLGL